MNNNTFENISFNFYSNTTSYVKTILDVLPETQTSKEKKAIIAEIYNYLLNGLNRDKLNEVVKVSEMFNERLVIAPKEEIMMQVQYIYKNFLEKMIFDSYNREIYFSIMNECVKAYVGYYQTYNDNMFYEENYRAVGNIRIR